MKDVFIPMSRENQIKICNGQKTTTIRSQRQFSEIGLRIGESTIISFNDENDNPIEFYVSCRGLLSIQEAGGMQAILKSEGVCCPSEFQYNQTRNWIHGSGKLYVYDFKFADELEG